MFEHLHPVDDIIRRAKEELQALTPFHLSEESLFDDVRDKLLADDALVDSMIAWTGANLGLSTSQATYPDRGIILNTLTDIMAHLVWDESGKIVDDLSDYKRRMEALDVEYFPVCPQRNIIISDNIHDGDDGEEEEEDSMDEDEHNKTRLQSLVTTWRNEERLVSSTDELYIDSIRLANRWNACLEQILVQISTGDYTQSIVNVIKQMKEVKKQVYSTAPYRLAMKDSGLTTTIETISHPMFIHRIRNAQTLHLENTYRIGDQLSDILDKWTPMSISEQWPKDSPHYTTQRNNGKDIQSARRFLEIFNDHPNFVPGEENISYCFFLANLHSFEYHYSRWLGMLLDEEGYNVYPFNNIEHFNNFYSQVLKLMKFWCTEERETKEGKTVHLINKREFKNPRWRTIIKHTCWLRQQTVEASEHGQKLTRCKNCSKEPPSKHCVQYAYLPHITHGLLPTEANQMLTALRKELIGCGVSKVPFLDQVEPTQRTKEPLKARGSYNNAMYHPVAVGNKRPVMLQGLEHDEEIIERCGHHLLLILDEKEDTQNPYSKLVEWATNVIDFIWWNPFSATTLALIQDAVVESTGVSSVNRGAQFESYAGGKMIPLGSRSASGGRAGDTYTSYAGLEATSDKGLGILFRQAATSDIMRSTAQHAHYMLAKDLAKMGMTGANIFNCTGYMAPLHTDKDAVREYQYYIKTTTNCLW
ncbi:hypothetical protein F5880DRAFT_1511501 [Lentinula raphanica]|nr:hypothetical protein F5880DRAFT_1511501 [Lentinula raphanica]